ncbi:helix-turn-helix domain-containing protein [Chelatococcus sambhunathii]|uniref:Helix-turn-helix domain-containing protein n=1 Tax=Chelatococcus sambhunathii TaxID=363953 RepID=A0ABU1DHU4_9HYPH|nr:helix-turn-helix domain-containing protein [Chelatococcus sambhunathii]MDR4307706.1 helix-turn-helix domain-containing protein [Chelatococcus sambhunathii]
MDRLRFSSDAPALADDDGFGAYHDLYATVADAERLDRSFAVEVEGRRLNELLLFDRSMRAVRHVRSEKRVMRNGFDHFTVQIPLSGELLVSTDNGGKRAGPGEAALIDMSRPMATEARSARVLTLSTPRRAVEEAAGGADGLHGVVLPRERAALLTDFLASALRNSGAYGVADEGRIATVVLELLRLSMAGRFSDERALGDDASDAVCRRRARAFIDANLSAGPDEVARALGRSRSALYRAFKASGGVARFIRSRRLVRLRGLLSRPGELRKLAELSHEAGFASDSDAIRAFRAAYDVTPGEFRAGRRLAAPVAPEPGAPSFERWWNGLR